MKSQSTSSNDRLAAGFATRREVMGDKFVDEALKKTAGTESESLQNVVTELVWGGIWTRPGLERKTRSLLNVALLTALRAHEELSGHIRGALTNGASTVEIVETIIHSAGYVGAPAALSAMKVAQKVFDDTAAKPYS